MRDLVVREGLRTMAREAAKLLRELIAAGEEIPYEVREPGDGSALCRYEPLTERFIREHAGALRQLDSFGAACAALEASDLAGPYLEQLRIPVPPEPGSRAELAAIVFLCRLWVDSADLSLDHERLDAAVEELEAGGEAPDGEIEVVVPVRGLQMPVARLELATATIVRADTVDVPPEVRTGDIIGASPWEPTFLAVAGVHAPDEPADASDVQQPDGTDSFRRLITTLRLFKAGGVSLGPHAWVGSASNRWRRISTGAGRARPGGYRLAEHELGELVAFERALASRETPFGRLHEDRHRSIALARAISRFEAGLERALVIEALSDNLLALRFVLEGGGPADLGLAIRVAALCAQPERRWEVKAVVERAEALERELWSGEPQGGGPVPAETAMRLEDLTRAILKDAACGHLGGDLRTTADEILLADGLAVGDGADDQRGETAEWEGSASLEEVSPAERRITEQASESEEDQMTLHEMARPVEIEPAEPQTAVLETLLEPEDPLHAEAEPLHADAEGLAAAGGDPRDAGSREPDLDRVPEGSPVLRLIEEARTERRERADRLEGLFPRPETEWNVRELSYDRHRRAEVSSAP
jgi:hypothetical protein